MWRSSLELPRRGGSNEYQQSVTFGGNRNDNVYPHMPQFVIRLVFGGGGGLKLYRCLLARWLFCKQNIVSTMLLNVPVIMYFDPICFRYSVLSIGVDATL